MRICSTNVPLCTRTTLICIKVYSVWSYGPLPGSSWVSLSYVGCPTVLPIACDVTNGHGLDHLEG